MRVGIVGSRRRLDRESVERLVRSLARTDIVISGGCRGVDRWAVEEADKLMMSHVEHLPALRPGMDKGEMVQAYYGRNRLIAMDSDVVYAFVATDRTGGTENTIKHCEELGVEVVIMRETQDIDETNENLHCPICGGDGLGGLNEECRGCLGTGKTEPIISFVNKLGPKVYNKHGHYPKDAVYVGRPTKWGNRFSHMPGTLAKSKVYSREEAVDMYEKWLYKNHLLMAQAQQELAGKDLVCWCKPLPCHADILLRVANMAEVDET